MGTPTPAADADAFLIAGPQSEAVAEHVRVVGGQPRVGGDDAVELVGVEVLVVPAVAPVVGHMFDGQVGMGFDERGPGLVAHV